MVCLHYHHAYRRYMGGSCGGSFAVYHCIEAQLGRRTFWCFWWCYTVSDSWYGWFSGFSTYISRSVFHSRFLIWVVYRGWLRFFNSPTNSIDGGYAIGLWLLYHSSYATALYVSAPSIKCSQSGRPKRLPVIQDPKHDTPHLIPKRDS